MFFNKFPVENLLIQKFVIILIYQNKYYENSHSHPETNWNKIMTYTLSADKAGYDLKRTNYLHMKTISLFIAVIFSSMVIAQSGSWKQLGKAGDWANTALAVESKSKIYTIEKNGTLLETDPLTGISKQIGKPDYQNTRFLFAANNLIYTIETSGSLYSINPVDGSWKQIGKQGAWENTVTAAILNGKLYTVEKSGLLNAADLSSGEWIQIGNAEFANTARLWAARNRLYTHDLSGSLYEVNITDGTSKQIGATEGWSDTKTGVIINDMLYTVEISGTLYETDLSNGKWKQIGSSEYQNTILMTGTGAKIHTIESSGSLYEISIQ